MQKFFVVLASSFFLFILWMIYLANTGQYNSLFKLVTLIPYGDKVGHFCLFGMLTFLANVSSTCRYFSVGKLKIYWGSFVVLAFVTIEELSQYFLPTRTLDIYDYAADLVGIFIFSYLSKISVNLYFHHWRTNS